MLKYNFLVLTIVAGFALSGNAHADCRSGERRETNRGAVFTCDTSHSDLGEAWRAPNGLIWGDIVKKTDGTIHHMDHDEATNYCGSIAAYLPSDEEFIQLREYMGARSGSAEGYSAQALPNLSGHWFWSSSVGLTRTHDDFASFFVGDNGMLGKLVSDAIFFRIAVRCVRHSDI